MNSKNRIFHILFVLVLLLGLLPVVGNAAPAAPPASEARPLRDPVAAPAAPQAAAFPPLSTLSVDERLRLNTVERFEKGVAAFDNVNGYGYFVAASKSPIALGPETIVKVHLADNTRVGAIGFWPSDGSAVVALADPQHDMVYFGMSGDPAKIVRVRLSTFKRVDAITLPEGIALHGEALMSPDQASAYLTTDNGLIQVRLPDFAILGGVNDMFSNWVGPLTLDEANGRLYTTGSGRICAIELADMSWDCQSPSVWGSGPVIDVARGFAYYASEYTMFKIRLSDMAYFTTTLTSPDPLGRPIAISPDNEFAYLYYQNTYVSPPEGTLYRVRLSDFTLDWTCGISTYYDDDFDNPVMNPGSGTVYVGLDRQDGYGSGSEYDPYKIGAYWGEHGDNDKIYGCNNVRFSLYADQETAMTTMLDAANGYAYFYGQVGMGQPSGSDSATYYGLTKVRLSDFTRSGALEVMTVEDLGGTEEFMSYMGGGINLQDGDIHLAFHFQDASALPTRSYKFRRVHLADDTVGWPSSDSFDSRWVDEYPPDGGQQVLYDFPQGVVYHSPGRYGLSRSVVQSNAITTTYITETVAGYLLAVDGLHDHVYTYNPGDGIHKWNGTDLSLEATLPLTGALGDIEYFFALDPANDAAYTYGEEDLGGYYVHRLFKLRLSDFSVVMSRTVPYIYPSTTQQRQVLAPADFFNNYGNRAVLDPESGYGYFLQSLDPLVQFRLDDLSITDYVYLDAVVVGPEHQNDTTSKVMALDPEEGAIYIAAGKEVLKIGLGGGKRVTPAANVPYHGTVTYTLNLAGHMTLTDTHVVLTDTLPAEVDFADWVEQPAGATVTDDVIHWSGQLDPREVVTLTFTAQHNGNYNDTVLNTAEYSGTLVHRTMRAAFTVESPPPLPIVKSVTPAQAAAGDTVAYTLRFSNTTAVAATGLVITDALPVHILNPQVTSSISITARGGTQYVWDVDNDLASFESGAITITGQLSPDTPTGPLNNTATLLGVTDGVTHTHSASAVLDVSTGVPPKLSISKMAEEMNAAPLLVGDRILYTIRVTNITTDTLTGLTVTDTLPAGVTYFGIPKGSPRPAQTGNPIVWNVSSLAAGATQTFKVIGKVTGDPTPIGDNVATASCAEGTTPVSASANLDNPDVQEALTLLKDAVDVNGAPLLVDDVIRYTIHVTNTHASVALTGVVVTDTLPAGTVFVTATQPYTEADGTLWWQVGDLAPGATWTVAVDQRVDGTTNPIAGNNAAVWCDQQDWQGTGNIYPPDPIIQTQLKLGKTADEYRNAPPLLENDRILYTIRVTNTTTGTLTNLTITDTLPAGVTYFGIPKGAPRPTQSGNSVVWTQSTLAAGATQTFKVIVKVDGTANPIGENVARATCAEEATPAAAIAQVPGDGVHEPGLVITGTVGGGGTMLRAVRAPAFALDVGDLLTYTVTVHNGNSTLTMHNLVVTVTLPSGTELVSATPPGSAMPPVLVWNQAELGPGADWQVVIVLRQTGSAVRGMEVTAASDEQSPVEISIAPPGGYRIYLLWVARNYTP